MTTQTERPWRTTARTVFQLVVGFAPVFPEIVQAASLSESTPWVGGGLAISGAVTRVMALPSVEKFLARFAPWLAADPHATPRIDQPTPPDAL